MDFEKEFEMELSYIKDKEIKEALLKVLKLLPDYFFTVAASSTGKYHPDYALGDGGLLRHSKAAMRIGYELLSDPAIGDKYLQHEKDLMLMALLIHDGVKHGIPKEKYVRFDHPILMAEFLMEYEEEIGLEMEDIEFLCDVIKTHMGVWTKDYNGEEILEPPKTKYQNFVHMCDYLASRKCLHVPFDKQNKISV